VRFLSDVIEDANVLRALVQKTASELKLPWNLSFYDGKHILRNIEESPEPHQYAAVLGGNSQVRQPLPGSVVLGGTIIPKPEQPKSEIPPNNHQLPICPARKGIESQIEEVNSHVRNGTARFKDFRELKSGRDEFSKLRGESLLARIPKSIQEHAKETLDICENEDVLLVDRVYRWWLRGLRIDTAIRKVRVDSEVARNAIQGHYKKIENWKRADGTKSNRPTKR
jgi:ribonuclease HI